MYTDGAMCHKNFIFNLFNIRINLSE
jgi:hypothetical protein